MEVSNLNVPFEFLSFKMRLNFFELLQFLFIQRFKASSCNSWGTLNFWKSDAKTGVIKRGLSFRRRVDCFERLVARQLSTFRLKELIWGLPRLSPRNGVITRISRPQPHSSNSFLPRRRRIITIRPIFKRRDSRRMIFELRSNRRWMHVINTTCLTSAIWSCSSTVVDQQLRIFLFFNISLLAHFDINRMLLPEHPCLLQSVLSRLFQICMISFAFVWALLNTIRLKIYHLTWLSICPRVIFVELRVFDLRILVRHAEV